MVFVIFTIGRTGSTLLINILNKFEGVTFAGEIYSLDLLDRINGSKPIRLGNLNVLINRNKLRVRSSCDTNYIPRNTILYKYFRKPHKLIQLLENYKTVDGRLKVLLPEDKIVGFKLLGNANKFEWFSNFKNLPFKIIVLVRENIDELRGSMKRAGFSNWRKVDLEGENRRYKEIYNKNKDRMYYVSYEDILRKTKRFKNLFKFMNIEYDNNLVISGMSDICSYASSYKK